MSISDPRTTHADLAIEIWLEIFRYATYVPAALDLTPIDAFIPQQPSNNALGPNTYVLSMRTKYDLVLVCRAWRQVTMQLLYEYIPIKSPRRADLILRTFRESRRIPVTGETVVESYGKWARHIQIQTFAKGSKSMEYLQKVFLICQYCPNARMLSGVWQWALPQSFHDAVSRLYGTSLQGLLWDETGHSSPPTPSFATPRFFETFQSLRVLHMNLYAADISKFTQPSEPRAILPHVEHIILSANNPTLLVAAALHLPMLSRATLAYGDADPATAQNFLRVHGPRITYLDLSESIHAYLYGISQFLKPDGCPNLLDFVYNVQALPMGPLDQPHTSLRRIGLRGIDYRMIRGSVRSHFRSFNRVVFPALEVVRTVGFLLSQTLRAYSSYDAQDEFIRWVEQFERDGIDLQDGEGVIWLRSEDDDETSQPTRFQRWAL
jgi:hypothetical protein